MERAAQAALLVSIGAMLAMTALVMLRNRHMKNAPHFDPNIPEHVTGLAVALDKAMNANRADVRFALVVWQDQADDVKALISNASDDKTVVEMLDDAKARIINAETMRVHPSYGHA